MNDQTLHLNLNLTALWSSYFVKLQRLLDVNRLLQVGATVVTEEQITNNQQFITFQPSSNSRLPFPETQIMAEDWLLKSFLRDSIEITGLFLDECLSTCAVLLVASKKKANGLEINHLLTVLPKQNHRLPFPEKVKKLEQDFGVKSTYTSHVLTINKARTCVVHTLGVVSSLDVDDTKQLKIKWQTAHFVAVDVATGKETMLDRPGILIENESIGELRFVDYEKVFSLGENIRLSAYEMYCCIVTFFRYATETAQAIENYGRSLGLGINEQKGN